ncbi:MAG TPA: hypothetical protein VN861_10415 [Candidatus Acidoferrales bacterium]|nr:hypothetical protein [Candidatus Acidoferrales bacterium]
MTVSCPSNAGKCQVGVTSGIVVSNSVKADFTSGASSSAISAHNVIWNVPTSDLTLNTQSPVQATLKATTDTNYQSSITVTLTPVASATSPVVTGYSVYTFGVESSAALSNWLSEVTANINSTGNLSVSSNPLFNELGNAGTYTVYVQVKSVQAGVTTLGSATYSDPGTPPPTRCTGSNCPNQP